MSRHLTGVLSCSLEGLGLRLLAEVSVVEMNSNIITAEMTPNVLPSGSMTVLLSAEVFWMVSRRTSKSQRKKHDDGSDETCQSSIPVTEAMVSVCRLAGPNGIRLEGQHFQQYLKLVVETISHQNWMNGGGVRSLA